MLYIPKTADYSKFLTYEEVKHFVLINLVTILNLREKNCILNYMKNKIIGKLLNRL